jgi:urease accessory protein
MNDAALLTLTQWLSPAFPLGSFAYSHGLEGAMALGAVRTAADVQGWVGDVVVLGSGRVDAVLLAASLRADADHPMLAATARAMAASRERLQETCDQGAAFTRTVNAITGTDHPAAPFPVAVGRAASALGLASETVVALYLNAFATTLVLAAVRFIPLGQTAGQVILAALHLVIADAARAAMATGIEDAASSTFGADLSAMAHETLQPRIFVT